MTDEEIHEMEWLERQMGQGSMRHLQRKRLTDLQMMYISFNRFEEMCWNDAEGGDV